MKQRIVEEAFREGFRAAEDIARRQGNMSEGQWRKDEDAAWENAKLLADANSWYSQAQLEEIALQNALVRD